MRRTIRQFVRDCAAQGMKAEAVWHAAEDKFYPLRSVGWLYVLKLMREFEQEAAAELRQEPGKVVGAGGERE